MAKVGDYKIKVKPECPLCGKKMPPRSCQLFEWLDANIGAVRREYVCHECAPQSGPRDHDDGLTNRQRTKKH